MNEPSEKDFLFGALKGWAISVGGALCDKCGEVIWPEIELVRCDHCIGEHGSPSREALEKAFRRHRKRIQMCEREEREMEEYYAELE